MIDKNKQYTTCSGLPVRIYATDAGCFYPIHGAVLINGAWISRSWTREGRYYINLNDDSSYDLIEVKPRINRTVWLNVYEQWTTVHTGKDDADFFAMSDRIACIQIEIDCEEGEGR